MFVAKANSLSRPFIRHILPSPQYASPFVSIIAMPNMSLRVLRLVLVLTTGSATVVACGVSCRSRCHPSGMFIRHIHLSLLSGTSCLPKYVSPFVTFGGGRGPWCVVFILSQQSSVAFCCIIDTDSAKTVLKTAIERPNKWCVKVISFINFNYIITTLISDPHSSYS